MGNTLMNSQGQIRAEMRTAQVNTAPVKGFNVKGYQPIRCLKSENADKIIAMDAASEKDQFVIKRKKCDPAQVAGCLQSAANLQRVNCKNIVQVKGAYHQCEDGQDYVYVITEYVQGMSLAEVMRRDPEYISQLGLETVMHWFVELLIALDFAHDQQVIHGALDAESIVINYATMEPVIVGFSLSASSYFSKNKEWDTNVLKSHDVSMLGAILYQLVAKESLASLPHEHFSKMYSYDALLSKIEERSIRRIVARSQLPHSSTTKMLMSGEVGMWA